MNIKKAAESITSLVEKSAQAWEDGNNSGDIAYLARMEEKEQRLGRAAEKLAKRYGVDRLSWPGLWPRRSC